MKQGSIDGQLVRTLLRLCNLATLVALMLFAAGFFGIPFTPVSPALASADLPSPSPSGQGSRTSSGV